MSDLIYKQDAKDAVDMALDTIDHVPEWVYDILLNSLDKLPSAEKAQLSGEDATFDCISRQAVLDLPIKRDICWFDGSVDEWINVEDIKELPSAQQCMTATSNTMVSETVKIPVMDGTTERLPSAEPRRKGKWIYGEKSCQDGWYCSECGGFIPWDYDFYGLDNIDFIEDFKTCPFCDSKMVSYTGADMREGEEE